MSLIDLQAFFGSHPLTKDAKIGAWWRFLKFQVVHSLLKTARTYRYVDSSVLVVEKGMTGATGNVYVGLHEFNDMAFVIHSLREGDLFIDIGANVGSYTVLASAVSHASSIAIEPVPGSVTRLLRNIKANGIDKRVVIAPCALGAIEGEVLFSLDADTVNQVVDESYQGEYASVRVSTLDTLMGDQHPLVMKIDVEGYEEQMLAGAKKTMASEGLQAVLIEDDSPNVRMQMFDYGFNEYSYDPFSRTLTLLDGRAAFNHLWIRDLKMIQERVRAASHFTVLGKRI